MTLTMTEAVVVVVNVVVAIVVANKFCQVDAQVAPELVAMCAICVCVCAVSSFVGF